jgi:hypothetical protein
MIGPRQVAQGALSTSSRSKFTCRRIIICVPWIGSSIFRISAQLDECYTRHKGRLLVAARRAANLASQAKT